MPASTENVDNCEIWCFWGSINSFSLLSNFQAVLTAETIFTVAFPLVEAFTTAETWLWSARYPKMWSHHSRKIVHHFLLFSSEPSTVMADVSKLLWKPTSYIILSPCSSALVPWIVTKRFLLASFAGIGDFYFCCTDSGLQNYVFDLLQLHAWLPRRLHTLVCLQNTTYTTLHRCLPVIHETA